MGQRANPRPDVGLLRWAPAECDVIRVAMDGWEREAVAGLLVTVSRAPRSVMVASFWPSRIRARRRHGGRFPGSSAIVRSGGRSGRGKN